MVIVASALSTIEPLPSSRTSELIVSSVEIFFIALGSLYIPKASNGFVAAASWADGNVAQPVGSGGASASTV